MIQEAFGEYRHSRHLAQDKRARVQLALRYRSLRKRLLAREYREETNDRGNQVLRDWFADQHLRIRGGSRYVYDNRLLAQGWEQYDTDQDASYFGVWVNRELRAIATFAEGDRSVVICVTRASFGAELAHMADFYGPPPPAFRVIDVGDATVTHILVARPTA